MPQLKFKLTTWNLEPLAKNDKDPAIIAEQKQIARKIKSFAAKWKNRDDYLKSPVILKQALDQYEKLMQQGGTYGKSGVYYWLRTQQDSLSPHLKAKNNKIEESAVKLQNEIEFFVLRIGMMNQPTQKRMIKSSNLKPYKHFLERIFDDAKYQLGEEEEKIMNLKSGPAYSRWKKMVAEFISTEEREVLLENGKNKKLNFPEIESLLSSQKKKTRDSAAKAFNHILAKHVSLAEHEINAIFMDKKINDELRGMPRPETGRFLSDDILPKTVDTLTSAVTQRFDLAKRYYKLKAKLFKVKKLEYHERNVPYGSLDKKITYKQAISLTYKVFSRLDPEFGNIFKMLVNEGRIDVYPKKGKRNNAFCFYDLGMPTYVFLNYTNKLRDVSILAHECGHAVNGEIMRKKENALNYGGTMATAEVASTFMEDLVLEELINKTDDKMRLAIMMSKLNGDISSISRQVAGHNFQQELHSEFRKRGHVSKEEIGKIFIKHMHSYMGPAVKQSPGSENWWVYWDHIRSYFYMYQYASGLLIAKSLQNEYWKDPSSIKKVKQFLSIGNSDSFENVFKHISFDVTKKKFWDQGLDQIQDLLDKTESLAKRLKKI